MTFSFDDHAINELGREVQAVYDRVLAQGRGKPVAEVKTMLASEWRTALGSEITDPQLSEDADLLAAGKRIEVRAD